MIMKRIIMSAALMALGLALAAQNINQSVQVDNDYQTSFADFQKSGPDIMVPDSLYSFDYSFDYSVFESPYRGSYEFTPYEIKVTPDVMGYDGGKFFLRAGAGYSMHPELDLVFNPVTRGDFAMSIHNTGRGYAGRYHGRDGLEGFNGYDLSDNLGVGGHWLLRGNTVVFDAGYDGIFASDGTSGSLFNSAYAGARITSAGKSSSYFEYEFGLDYRYGSDMFSGADGSLGVHNFKFDGTIGPVINETYSFLIDFRFEMDAIRDGRAGFSDDVSNFASATPHLAFSLGPVNLKAGARLDYLMKTGASRFTVAPVVDAEVRMFSGKLKAFAGIGGGQNLNSYWNLKSFNHFYSRNVNAPAVSYERFGAYLGIGGHFGSHFQYRLEGGFSSCVDMPAEYLRSVAFLSGHRTYAGAQLAWVSERLDVDGSFMWRRVLSDSPSPVFSPAPFSGSLKATYNWMKRIYAGVSLDGASSRRDFSAAVSDVPGYVDLGLYGEYRFGRDWGLWLRAGNLLGMAIERHPGYIEKGPYFTVGICLNLQDF